MQKELKIQLLFPKAILVIDDFLDNNIFSNLKTSSIIFFNENNFIKTNTLSVNSTHQTNDKLHLAKGFEFFTQEILQYTKLFAEKFNYHQDLISDLYIDTMWINISEESDFIFPHKHKNSIFSGAFYIEAPKQSKIIFYSDNSFYPIPDETNLLTSESYDFDCINNRLILFRSDTLHGNPKQPTGQKITISFNVRA
jgi:uncharacterized protein (TIGR02466 family)